MAGTAAVLWDETGPRSGRCSGNVTTWAPDRGDPDYQVISPTNQVISPNSHFYWSLMAGAHSALTCPDAWERALRFSEDATSARVSP
jgi:hypothetical protein